MKKNERDEMERKMNCMIAGSKHNDIIDILFDIEKRMRANPGMTLKESIEASRTTMGRYQKAIHVRAWRERSAKLWPPSLD